MTAAMMKPSSDSSVQRAVSAIRYSAGPSARANTLVTNKNMPGIVRSWPHNANEKARWPRPGASEPTRQVGAASESG
ncbi:MAG: hypothetical protein Tsb0020_05390 [Haliangiales bacterium]